MRKFVEAPQSTPVFPDLALLHSPQSVAVIGASPRGGYGLTTMRTLRRMGYGGAVYPVNPNYHEVDGTPCYRSLRDLPAPPDAVVIAVPAAAAPGVLAEAAEVGAGVAVVYASGFSETGVAGRVLQDELRRSAGERLQVLGPNCLGSIHFHSRAALWGLSPGARLRPGRIGLLSQSGNMALSLLYNNRGINFSWVISLGNQAHVGFSDLVAAMVQDPATDVILGIMEGVDDAARFVAAAEMAAGAGKPLVILKIGRSAYGARYTLAHTGSRAGAGELYDQLFRRTGVISVQDTDELMEVARALLAPRPQRPGTALLAFSGGECALAADLADRCKLEFLPPQPDLAATLAEILPPYASPGNPLDLTATAWDARPMFRRTLSAFQESAQYGLIALVMDVPPDSGATPLTVWTDVVEVAREVGYAGNKPFYWVTTHSEFHPEVRQRLEDSGIPVLHGLGPALRALSHLSQVLVPHRPFTWTMAGTGAVRSPGAALLARASAPILDEVAAKRLLGEYGVRVPPGALAHTPEQALVAAGELDYPVALRAQAGGLYLKYGTGAVAGPLAGPNELLAAWRKVTLAAEVIGPLQGVLVEAAVSPAAEVVVRIFRDAVFGLVLELQGGEERSVRLLPLAQGDVEELLLEVRASRWAADLGALSETLAALSHLAESCGGVLESVEVNPLCLLPPGEGCVAGDAVVVLRSAVERSERE